MFYALKWCVILHLKVMIEQTTTLTLIKLRQSKNRTIPVILFFKDSRISESTLRYFQMNLEQGKSQSFLRQYILIIAKMYDFYTLSYKPANAPPRLFLNQFITELSRGQILSWKPLKRLSLNYALVIIKDYSRWLSKNQDILTDREELSWAKYVSTSYKFLESNHLSELFETKNTQGHFASKSNLTILKSFPINRLFDLLKQANLREKLLISMLAFSGRRPSEMLHLFTQDIQVQNNELSLKVYHPSLSKIDNLSRKQYLKQHFNLYPRNEITGIQQVGYRGIKFENQKEYSSEVYFTFQMEKHLVPLHQEYMSVRSQYNHHPYYFINHKNGDPLTLKALESEFYTICEKIGLKREKGCGVNLIALRHFYGSYLSKGLQLDPLEIKRMMSQINPTASQNYFNDKQIVWSEMERIKL